MGSGARRCLHRSPRIKGRQQALGAPLSAPGWHGRPPRVHPGSCHSPHAPHAQPMHAQHAPLEDCDHREEHGRLSEVSFRSSCYSFLFSFGPMKANTLTKLKKQCGDEHEYLLHANGRWVLVQRRFSNPKPLSPKPSFTSEVSNPALAC